LISHAYHLAETVVILAACWVMIVWLLVVLGKVSL